jgi:hypothetical protein
MRTAHFIKVRENMDWDNYIKLTQLLRKKGCKQLPYGIIGKIYLSENCFISLANKIYLPNTAYLKYSSHCVSSNNGIWNCISIRQVSSSNEILLYTAGRTFPLYIAINY